ncbi:hypothetical protein NPIL_97271 [Nephila pilipes]|uniref:Uncharacterized protein n=1 Tax=Nephila pilipes TaxID=299642 RepID=A0A8X6NKE6_NEPPI|nr:hypothetical protein NPIL_97271 [Nephila pilipes]
MTYRLTGKWNNAASVAPAFLFGIDPISLTNKNPRCASVCAPSFGSSSSSSSGIQWVSSSRDGTCSSAPSRPAVTGVPG